MMKEKKVPMRKCTGCSEMKPKSELIRIVRNSEGEVSLDPGGKKPGRGAYICRRPECLAKAFSCRIAPEIYDALEERLSKLQTDGRE